MAPHVTSLYAAALALMFAALSVRTLLLRRKLAVPIGNDGSETIRRAIRVHGNFVDYVPLTLLLAALLEFLAVHDVVVHAVGACLLGGRALHAYGINKTPEDLRYRVVGMALMLTALGGAAQALLVLATLWIMRTL